MLIEELQICYLSVVEFGFIRGQFHIVVFTHCYSAFISRLIYKGMKT